MKNADGFNYAQAIEWIALNDEAGRESAFDIQAVSEMVTVVMTANLANKEPKEVAIDVIMYRMAERNKNKAGKT